MSLPSRPRPVVLVTGASAGIGAALARVYAEHGWDLVLTARREASLKALAEELSHTGAATTVLTEDLADDGAPRRLYDALQDRGLHIDGLVNNAGFSRTAGFLNTDPTAHAAMIRVMLAAPVELARLFAPAMVERGYGRILNVASLAG
ncbi:MAG TPA: SDR family NAD(P)-dependent oxidoreductase, partial [Brevundimonas sp.]